MPMRLDLSGFAEMQRELELLEKAVAGDATRVALRSAAGVIRDEMKLEAPILDEKTAQNTALPPGALKSGMTFTIKKIGIGVMMAVIGPKKGTGRAAHLVEYGHLLVRGGSLWMRQLATGQGKIIGYVKQHPFLRPSFEVSWRRALEAYAAELKTQLGKWVR